MIVTDKKIKEYLAYCRATKNLSIKTIKSYNSDLKSLQTYEHLTKA